MEEQKQQQRKALIGCLMTKTLSLHSVLHFMLSTELYNVLERCGWAHDNHALVRSVYPDNRNHFLTIIKCSLLKNSESMGDSGKPSGDWKSERISMTHLGNFSRSSSYVRSLVRQQFHHQSDQPATAWERLRGRLAQKSSFDYDEELPSFMKKREKGASYISDDENTSENEDEDDEEETYVYFKSANPNHRSSFTTDVGKQNVEPTVSASHESASLSSRRLSAPPSNSVDTEKQYTLPSTDAHSKILNRRLSLAENVIKNYSKYIRTPDESQGEGERAKSEREPGNKQPFIVAISEEESSPFADIKLVNRASPASSLSTNFLPNPDLEPGSSYTEPPTPADESDPMFFADVPVRRNSLTDVVSEDFSLTRSRTVVTPVSTKAKLVSDAKKLPRISQTSKTRSKKVSAKSRDEAMEMLRGDHEKLTRNRRLNRRIGRETVYQQLQRDQQRRARESAIFIQEMEQITASLKAINTRLDERMKVLDCADPPKVNARLQRILQVALAGVPLKNI